MSLCLLFYLFLFFTKTSKETQVSKEHELEGGPCTPQDCQMLTRTIQQKYVYALKSCVMK